jgi:hypothetical protein
VFRDAAYRHLHAIPQVAAENTLQEKKCAGKQRRKLSRQPPDDSLSHYTSPHRQFVCVVQGALWRARVGVGCSLLH